MRNRKIISMLIVAAMTAGLLAGCNKRNNDERLEVDAQQVTGLWAKANNPYEYWRFKSDGTGVTWDETPDPEDGEPEMTEEMSNLTYTWYISDGDVLMFDFTGAMANQDVPKYYYITDINATTMTWRDEYGLSYNLTKRSKK